MQTHADKTQQGAVAVLHSKAPQYRIRGLPDDCKLPFSQQHLNYHESRRAVQVTGFAQLRSPLCLFSLGRWKSCEKMLVSLLATLE
jgi:hypothetical protein